VQGFRVEAVWGRTRADAERTATALGIPFYTTKVQTSVGSGHPDPLVRGTDPGIRIRTKLRIRLLSSVTLRMQKKKIFLHIFFI
jgi:hypothetical protein